MTKTLNPKTMTSKDIQDYIEIDLGHDMKHDPDMLLEAIEDTAETFELDQWKLMRFMLANEPMNGTHSYGFHTSYGRAIRNHFSESYHS
jgi:hypothetical protein